MKKLSLLNQTSWSSAASIKSKSKLKSVKNLKAQTQIIWGRAISAPPFRRWTSRRRAVSAPDISAPFPILFFELWRKSNEAANSFNAVEREPVPTRVLNPNASEVSYKPKHRSYRKTKLNFCNFFFGGDFVGGILSGNRMHDALWRTRGSILFCFFQGNMS